MKIGGRNIGAHYLIGRRFAWTHQANAHPEFTCVSYKRGSYMGRPNVSLISVHLTTGESQWVDMMMLLRAIKAGILVEAVGPPFTNEQRAK